MKRIGFVAFLLLGMLGLQDLAEAADLAIPAPPPPIPLPTPLPPRWSGFYVGVNGGGAIGMSSQTLTVDPLIALLGVSTTGNYEVKGVLLGGTFGYNHQAGSFVVGVEADVDWTNIGGQVTGPIMGVPATFQTQLPWVNTVRGRIGYAFGPVLPYVTGGGAFGSVLATDSINIPGTGQILGGLSDVRLGWTAGVGLEYALGESWSIKAEYLYVDLGSDILVLDDVKLTAQIIRGGVNWRF
jgi:outer membrane immunogenic protein